MGRVLAGLATLLILVLAAAFIAPVFVDWSNYRGSIEEAASTVVGRPVKTKGAISLTLLPEPRLRVEGVSVGQIGQVTALTADAADISLALPSLLSGLIEAQSIKLVRPRVEVDLTTQQIGPPQPVNAIKTAVRALTVENGRAVIVYRQGQDAKRITAQQINGTISSQENNPYRFAGHFSIDGDSYELKSSVALSGVNKARISATLTDLGSKNTVQIDGAAFTEPAPIFEGSITSLFHVPFHPTGDAIEVQAKAVARVEMDGIALANLVVTVDPQKRSQILIGTAQADFAMRKASLNLEAKSFDVDGFLPPSPDGETTGENWVGVRTLAENILWTNPNFDLQLSVKSDQTQIKGELLSGLTIDADRSRGRWTVQRAALTLPGDTSFTASGTLGKANEALRVSGIVAAEGKNLGRLARWLRPSAVQGKRVSSKPFSIKGSVALSSEAIAFEGVTADIAETPFTGSLRIENGPPVRVTAVIQGDKFDLGDVEVPQITGGVAAFDFGKALDSLGVSQMFGASTGLEVRQADVTFAAKTIKSVSFEALNVTGRVKVSPELLSIAKLNIETTDGLAIQGDGSVPLREAGRGTFEGRVEARTADAFLQILSLTGMRDRFGSRNADDFTPAKADLAITSTGADVSFRSKGDAAGTRVDTDGQVRFQTAEGKPAVVSLNVNVSSLDGQKLGTQLLPSLAQANGGGQGSVVAHLSGPLAKLSSSLAIQLPQVQARFDGVTDYKDGAVSAIGKASATTAMSQAILPPALIPLLGIDSGGDLRLEGTINYDGARVTLERLRGDSARNSVTGRLVFDAGSNAHLVEGDIKADQLSLPAILSAFVVPAATDAQVAAPGYWSQQPFLISAFSKDLTLSIAARSLRIGEGLQLSQAQVAAVVANGRFDLTKLTGKLAGGDFTASGDLSAKGGIVVLDGKVGLTGADLGQVLAGGAQPAIMAKASLFASLSGQALSPRALIAVLSGRGVIGVSDGVIARLTPALLSRTADEMLTAASVTDDAIGKRLTDAVQGGDFRFRRERIPFTIEAGILQMRRGALRSLRDGNARIAGFVDVATGQADLTVILQPQAGKQTRWPNAQVTLAGPLREIGSAQRTVDVDDIVRLVVAKRAENDLKRFEGLNKSVGPVALPWTATTQETKPSPPRQTQDTAPSASIAKPAQDTSHPVAPVTPAKPAFADRVRELLQSQSSGTARGQASP